jgi:hypothetical protein
VSVVIESVPFPADENGLTTVMPQVLTREVGICTVPQRGLAPGTPISNQLIIDFDQVRVVE